jgi:hypothetical protein
MSAVTRQQQTLPGFSTGRAVNHLFVFAPVLRKIFAGLDAGLEGKQRLMSNRLSRLQNERNLYFVYLSKELSPCPL